MPDDILRLRATVVSEEALANIRKIGREIGMVPQQAGRGLAQLNSQFLTLSNTLKGLATGAAVRTLTDAAARVNELRYASVELRMGTTELRGWNLAAERVGISSQTMMQNMRQFSSITDGLKYDIGGVRSQLYALGAGPVVRSIMGTTDKAEQLRKVFQFKDTLLTEPNGIFKATEWMRLWGMGADSIRLTSEQAEAAMKRVKPLTEEAKESARKYQEQVAELGQAWNDFVTTAGVVVFPGLAEGLVAAKDTLDALNKILEKLPKLPKPGDFGARIMPGPGVGEPGGPVPVTPGGARPWWETPLRLFQPPAPGVKPMSFGGDTGEGPKDVVKHGVLEALIDFQSYIAGGGPGGGIMRASLGGGGIDNTPIGRAFRAAGGPGGAGPGTLPGGPQPSPGILPGGPGSVTPGTPGSSGPAGPGGSGGITAPAGTPVARQGLATVTTPSGKHFQVDARYAENFKGFLADYEAAGGVLGPNTGTLGTRPKNASGHPIGAAIDINQVARDVRRGGVTLPKEVENALADKWGLVSGANWRSPDAGHFGIRSSQAAAEALVRQGKTPPGTTLPGGGTRATWFHTGAPIGPWDDPSGRREGAPASGLGHNVPGIATPGRGGLGEWFQVTLPDGRVAVVRKTDVGPGKGAQSKGIGLDINAALASQLYPDPSDFPSGRPGFHVKPLGKNLPPGMLPGIQARHGSSRIDAANAPQSVQGSVNVTVNSNGTKASTSVKSRGGLWQKSRVTQHRQMQETSDPLLQGTEAD